MSISTYAELQTAVGNWLHRSDLTSIIPDLILMGEKYLFRHARTRDMETALNLTIASGVAAVPADYVEVKYAYIDGSPVQNLQRKTSDWIVTNYPTRSSSGKPKYIGRDGSNFIFGPYPNSGYSVKGIYYARLTSIQTSANALFTANPDLYLFAALAEAAPYLKNDQRVVLWVSKRDSILGDVNDEDKRESSSGGSLAVTPG